jgi:DNA-binding IclR family transcriptional regulator
MPVVPSPAVIRSTEILKILASEQREFTLSELARRASIGRGSCQTLVLALLSAGLVARRETGPTYTLGLGLVALGEAAKASSDLVSLTQTELIPLRERFLASGMAGAVSGRDVVIFTVASQPHPLGYRLAAGTRFSFRAPFGLIYIAWADSSEIEAWFEPANLALSKRRKAQIVSDLSKIRARGWSASVRMSEASRDLLTVREITDRELQMDGLNIAGISAPVTDASGKMACSLALTAFSKTLSGIEVFEIAAALKVAAARIGRQLGATHHP